jgi:hypothetical protein
MVLKNEIYKFLSQQRRLKNLKFFQPISGGG